MLVPFSLLLCLCLPYKFLELCVILLDEPLVKLHLAQGTVPLILAPGQDARAMEVVSRVARQGRDHLPLSEVLNADGALGYVPLQREVSIFAFIQGQEAQRLLWLVVAVFGVTEVIYLAFLSKRDFRATAARA